MLFPRGNKARSLNPDSRGEMTVINLPNDQECLSRYVAPNPSIWKGRGDAGDCEYIYQAVQCIDWRQCPPKSDNSSYGIIGFCSDEGVRRNLGNAGAAEGPESMRASLAKLPIHSERPLKFYDCGDICCSDGDLETSQKALGKIVYELLSHDIHPIVIGGGHEIAWGTYQGIAAAKPNANIGIINFDAHYDLRPLLGDGRGSSGTPFNQIALDRKENNLDFNYLCIGIQRYGNTRQLIERASELNVTTIYADELFEGGLSNYQKTIQTFINKCESIYLSICLDVFEASICPGVSAPQVLGLYPWQVIHLMREIISNGKMLCIEVAELSPKYDINMRSAKLGATLICDYVHHHH